jgi:predicted nuclease of predicted toxin-antitoxin system
MAVTPSLFIRLYLDEDVHPAVAVALRARGFDAVSAHEVGRRGVSDAEQLTCAATDGRALLTFNAVDFLNLHRESLETERSHWGIILCEQASVGEVVRRLLQLLNRVAADELCNQIYWLSGLR